jgi:hypothetical protein
MHHINSAPNPSRRRRRRALGVLAVAGGTYGAYQLARHVRAGQQSPDEQSSGEASRLSASMWWSGVMLLLYRAMRTAHESTPLPRHSPNAPTSRARVGKHTQWLETFRTEQAHRLRSDPPTTSDHPLTSDRPGD